MSEEPTRADEQSASAGFCHQLVAQISAQLAHMPEGELPRIIDHALAQLGTMFSADRAYVFRYNVAGTHLTNTQEWCAPQVTAARDTLLNIPIDTLPWWHEQINIGYPVVIEDVNALPPVATAEQQLFKEQHIRSMICLPLLNAYRRLMGFIGLDYLRDTSRWTRPQIELLQVVTNMFASAIAQRETNEALRDNQQRFENMAEQNRIIIWEVDPQGCFTYISSACYSVLGYAPVDVVGKRHFYDFHPEEGRAPFRKKALARMQHKESFRDLINPIQTDKGQLRWMLTNGQPTYHPDGTLKGYHGSDIDITERYEAETALREAHDTLEQRVNERTAELQRTNDDLFNQVAKRIRTEERLRDSEDRYRRVVQATQSFVFTVWIHDGSEFHTLHERGVKEVTGYSAHDYRDDPELWHQMIDPEDRALVSAHIQRLHSGAPLSVVEHRMIHRNGERRWVRNTSLTRFNNHGVLVGYDGLITDITNLKQTLIERDELLESLRRSASHDAMTGLRNRRGLNEELERVWSLAQRHPFPVGLLVVDIDHFKSINDTYGHMTGDAVLKEYADLLEHCVRESDSVSRYAGDELVVVLPWADKDETRYIGERILRAIEAHVFCKDEHDLTCTVSIGGCARTPNKNDTTEHFLNTADRALYRAKQGGRNKLIMPHTRSRGSHVSITERGDGFTQSAPGALVLVVDDEPILFDLFARILVKDGIRVISARNSTEAIQAVHDEHGMIDVAIIDVLLGTEDGFELMKRIKQIDDLIVPIVVTGQVSPDTTINALRYGAFDFLTKPIVLAQLPVLVERAIGHRRVLLENRRYRDHLEEMVKKKGQSLSRALEKEKAAHEFALEAMAALLNVREAGTGEHCQRVADMAHILAIEMGLSEEDMVELQKGALLHDIGKVGVPDTILLKEGALTKPEWRVMEQHPEIGHRIMVTSPALKKAADIVLMHQEKYDGTGYPSGLAGEDICLGARIFAVIDAYDAMRSTRPYSAPRSSEDALKEIVRESGRQFDPAVVEAFIRCHSHIEAKVRWAHDTQITT